MKLNAFNRKLMVAQPHHEAIFGLRSDSQRRTHRRSVNDERVITRCRERKREPFEHALVRVSDLRRLAVHDRGCPHDITAVYLADALMPEAHAQYRRTVFPEALYRVDGHPRVLRASRTR